MKEQPKLALVFVACFSLVMLAFPALAQSSPAYPTTALAPSTLKETILQGYPGVLVDYNNTLSSSYTAAVFVDLTNSAGQVVSLSVGSCAFSGSQTTSCFVAFSPSTPSGSYKATVFVVSSSYVPLSVTSTLTVTV